MNTAHFITCEIHHLLIIFYLNSFQEALFYFNNGPMEIKIMAKEYSSNTGRGEMKIFFYVEYCWRPYSDHFYLRTSEIISVLYY